MSREEELQQELARAEQHISEFKQRISAQEALVAELERDGHPTKVAQSLLRQFRESLRLAHEHRELLLKELADLDPRNSN